MKIALKYILLAKREMVGFMNKAWSPETSIKLSYLDNFFDKYADVFNREMQKKAREKADKNPDGSISYVKDKETNKDTQNIYIHPEKQQQLAEEEYEMINTEFEITEEKIKIKVPKDFEIKPAEINGLKFFIDFSV